MAEGAGGINESLGKSAFMYPTIANEERDKNLGIFLDTLDSLNQKYAKNYLQVMKEKMRMAGADEVSDDDLEVRKTRSFRKNVSPLIDDILVTGRSLQKLRETPR